VDIRFNEGKTANVLLYCKEYRNCSNFISGTSILMENKIDLFGSSDIIPRIAGNTSNSLSGNLIKLRGINLAHQTMLVIADFEAIINHLSFRGGISLIESTSGNSHLNLNHKAMSSNNSRLSNFIELTDPTKSFLDLSLMLDEPVEEVSKKIHFPVESSFPLLFLLLLVNFHG
jgi:hypothetical protein